MTSSSTPVERDRFVGVSGPPSESRAPPLASNFLLKLETREETFETPATESSAPCRPDVSSHSKLARYQTE